MPHAALWVVQHYDLDLNWRDDGGFNAARGFVGGAARTGDQNGNVRSGFNAARGFVGGAAVKDVRRTELKWGFNAARGFVGGAASNLRGGTDPFAVSMPHAALWVVQQSSRTAPSRNLRSFNAARGFVGGAAGALMPHAAIPFRPYHRFAVPLPRSRMGGFSVTAFRLLSPMRGT